MARTFATRTRRLLAVLLLASLFVAPAQVRADGNDWQHLRDQRDQTGQQLAQVTTLRQDAMAQLFQLQLTADAATARVAQINALASVNLRQAQASETEAARLSARTTALQARLATRMRYYQQHGNTGYLDVLLGSSSVADLLQRARLVWLVLSGDLSMLSELHTLSDRLQWQENHQMRLGMELGALQDEAQAASARAATAVSGQQTLLGSLADQAGSYQAELKRLHDIWSTGAQAKLAAFGSAFADLPNHASSLQPDTPPELHLLQGYVTFTLHQATLNAFMQQEPDLAGLDLTLDGTYANLSGSVQGVPLVLHGRFVIEQNVLRYVLESADFAGYPLPPDALGPLQQSGQLSIDLSALLKKGWTIRSVKQVPGAVTVDVGVG